MSGCAEHDGKTFAEVVSVKQAGISGHQQPDGGDTVSKSLGPGDPTLWLSCTP